MRKGKKETLAEKLQQARESRLFVWGVTGLIASVLLLGGGFFLEGPARERVEELSRDPRFTSEVWERQSVEEQQRLGREMMSARNNLTQIAIGRIVFSVTLTICALLVILPFVRGKSKIDEFIEQNEDGNGG
jgi:hypothetical protein